MINIYQFQSSPSSGFSNISSLPARIFLEIEILVTLISGCGYSMSVLNLFSANILGINVICSASPIQNVIQQRCGAVFVCSPGRSRQTQRKTNNRTPHPTDMKYLMARGPPVSIIRTGGVLTTVSYALKRNCRDFLEGQAKNTFAICSAILR